MIDMEVIMTLWDRFTAWLSGWLEGTKEGKKIMNVAIYVHHGLADGYHIAKHLDIFQKLIICVET